jgi:hypothetical protein
VYEWDWQKGELAVKSFTPQEKRPTLPVRASLPANRTRHLHQARSGV